MEYEAGDVKLRFHAAPPLIEDLGLQPMLDEVVRLFGLAKGPHIKPGVYDIILILEIRGNSGPLVGCAYLPDDQSWERARRRWPAEMRKLVPGAFIAVTVSQFLEDSQLGQIVHSQLGHDGMLVDLADTLHHELIHLNTGVLHEGGRDDLCLRDSERFLKEVVERHPLDTRVVRRLLEAAAIRRRTGLG